MGLYENVGRYLDHNIFYAAKLSYNRSFTIPLHCVETFLIEISV